MKNIITKSAFDEKFYHRHSSRIPTRSNSMKRLIYLLLFLILPLCGMTECTLDESVSFSDDAVYTKNAQSGQTEYKPVTAHYHNHYAQTVYLT